MALLVHACCAPCLEYPSKILNEEGIRFDAYFFNPNIQPHWEYKRRKDNLMKFSGSKEIEVIYSSPSNKDVRREVDEYERKWISTAENERCEYCYRTRLEKTAEHAAEKGYEKFTTTLLLSIYQKHDLIKRIGSEVSDKYSVEFYYRDFRSGFRESQILAKEDRLYRQKYCGCICSLNRSALKEKILKDAPC